MTWELSQPQMKFLIRGRSATTNLHPKEIFLPIITGLLPLMARFTNPTHIITSDLAPLVFGFSGIFGMLVSRLDLYRLGKTIILF